MDFEHRRVDDGDAVDENVAPAHGFDEIRPEIAAFAEFAVPERSVLLAHRVERVASGLLAGLPFAPAAIGTAFPRPPVFAIAVAVERALAGDCNVVLAVGINERRVVQALQTFPAGIDQREIALRVAHKAQCGPGGDVELHLALEANGPGHKDACGDHDAATACLAARGDGAGDRIGTVFGCIARSAVPGDLEVALGENGRPDARQNVAHLRPSIQASWIRFPVPRPRQRRQTRRGPQESAPISTLHNPPHSPSRLYDPYPPVSNLNP